MVIPVGPQWEYQARAAGRGPAGAALAVGAWAACRASQLWRAAVSAGHAHSLQAPYLPLPCLSYLPRPAGDAMHRQGR